MGEWLNKNDQIQLNSKKLSSEESLSMSLSSATWFTFKNRVFRIRNAKLIDLENSKMKFKKKQE